VGGFGTGGFGWFRDSHQFSGFGTAINSAVVSGHPSISGGTFRDTQQFRILIGTPIHSPVLFAAALIETPINFGILIETPINFGILIETRINFAYLSGRPSIQTPPGRRPLGSPTDLVD
jgi:hypothetical protein